MTDLSNYVWPTYSILLDVIHTHVRFEAFTAVTMKNVFWDVALCRSCVNGRFGGTYRLHLKGRKIRERGTSVSMWLQPEPPVGNNQLYKNREWGSRPHGKPTGRKGVRGEVCCEGHTSRWQRDVYERQGIGQRWGKIQGYYASIDPVASGLEMASVYWPL
jgi:hypothetical protein